MRFWEEEFLSHTWLAFAIKSKNHGSFMFFRKNYSSLSSSVFFF